jgi:hypothetical protein
MEGEKLFEGFTKKVPLTIPMTQYEIEVTEEKDCTILATMTLPYNMTGTDQFAAIHSDPPGIYTDRPCAIAKKYKNATILWVAAPIEMSRPYLSKQVFANMITQLSGELKFRSNAPKFVEVLNWNKDGKDYFALINQQEESPVAAFYDIYVEVQGAGKTALELVTGAALKTESMGDRTRIYIPKIELYTMFEIVEAR